MQIVSLDVLDGRFPTSEQLDGSDAMNPEPDYSAAYVRLGTDAGDGHEGHALAFTTGRGSVFGSRPVPTVKLATNAELAGRMAGDIDLDCSPVIEDGVPLEENPERAGHVDVMFRAAALFWHRRGLNALADQHTPEAYLQITKRVNGPAALHHKERIALWREACEVMGIKAPKEA